MEGSAFLDRYKPIMSSFIASTKDYNLASVYHERIQVQIEDFCKELEKDEMAMVTVPLKNGTTVVAEWFGYYNPSMILVEGKRMEDGHQVRLLIHQTDLQIVMQKVKSEEEKPVMKKIGFQLREKEAEQP